MEEFSVGEVEEPLTVYDDVERTRSIRYVDDLMQQRCPNTTRAQEILGREPRVSARKGLEKTLGWFAGRRA